MALIARMTRASVLEVLEADHVRTERAKGLPGVVVLNPESDFDLRVVSERHRSAGG